MVEYNIYNINRKICKCFWQCIMVDYNFIYDVSRALWLFSSGLVLVLQATPFTESVAARQA